MGIPLPEHLVLSGRTDADFRGVVNFAFTAFSDVGLRVALTVSALAPFWASLRTVAEPKPPAPPVTIAEALLRSIKELLTE
jgi:hypothetical protein